MKGWQTQLEIKDDEEVSDLSFASRRWWPRCRGRGGPLIFGRCSARAFVLGLGELPFPSFRPDFAVATGCHAPPSLRGLGSRRPPPPPSPSPVPLCSLRERGGILPCSSALESSGQGGRLPACLAGRVSQGVMGSSHGEPGGSHVPGGRVPYPG